MSAQVSSLPPPLRRNAGLHLGWELGDFIWLWMIAEAGDLLVAAAMALVVAVGQGRLRRGHGFGRSASAPRPARFRDDELARHDPDGLKEADTLVGRRARPRRRGPVQDRQADRQRAVAAADPLYQAVYPELARLWSSGDRAFRHLVSRSTASDSSGSATSPCLGGREWALVSSARGMVRPTRPRRVSCGGGPVGGQLCLPSGRAGHGPAHRLLAVLVATLAYFVLLVPALHCRTAAPRVPTSSYDWTAIGTRLRRWMVEPS